MAARYYNDPNASWGDLWTAAGQGALIGGAIGLTGGLAAGGVLAVGASATVATGAGILTTGAATYGYGAWSAEHADNSWAVQNITYSEEAPEWAMAIGKTEMAFGGAMMAAPVAAFMAAASPELAVVLGAAGTVATAREVVDIYQADKSNWRAVDYVNRIGPLVAGWAGGFAGSATYNPQWAVAAGSALRNQVISNASQWFPRPPTPGLAIATGGSEAGALEVAGGGSWVAPSAAAPIAGYLMNETAKNAPEPEPSKANRGVDDLRVPRPTEAPIFVSQRGMHRAGDVLDEVPEEEVIRAIRSVPVHRAHSGAPLYEVGLAKDLRSNPFHGRATETVAEHVPQTKWARDLIPDHKAINRFGHEPAIRVTEREALALTKAEKLTPVPASARDALAMKIRLLRQHTDAPNFALQQLIELNKKLHPYDYLPLQRQ